MTNILIENKKFYTGIGSRNTPLYIIEIITQIAIELEKRGYILRSGGADGADLAFEKGVRNIGNKEIFLPWKGFNGSKSNLFYISEQALQTVNQYHQYPQNLSSAAKKLMARNAYQVLGYDLCTPSSFVVCWTSDGCINHNDRNRNTGGTGQAISIASLNNIPVFNLNNTNHFDRIVNWLNKTKG